ncbi:MAG: pyridoxamine 5'-phosphate oxidase [Deltaproteobacteria bacterium]|nr:pyridoxamine 5'-phosphate oxidase [Deltaproteobacteria bacterium]
MDLDMKPLDQEGLLPNPLEQFHCWYDEACRLESIQLPSACCMSTVGLDGLPDGRMMLLKECDDRGFVVYTNIESVKGRSLAKKARAALTFYWEDLRRQIRIQGEVEQVSAGEASAYFKSRPRESQIGAWASKQSDVLEDRAVLDRRFEDLLKKYEGKEVPRPPYWTGFRVIPAKIEFWQERPNRLHDRFVYTKEKEGWKIVRLYP